MRVIFCGTAAFAVPSLHALAAAIRLSWWLHKQIVRQGAAASPR